MLKKRKFWLRLSLFLVLVPVLLFTITLVVIYSNQDKIVQHFIQTANEDFKGEIVLEDSHIAPFANFPYISIDLEGFSVFENKDLSKEPVIELEDLYIGFNLWSLLSGSFDIKSVSSTSKCLKIIHNFSSVINYFMETVAAILVIFPIVFQISTLIGMDPVHFGVMAVLALMVGLITPPLGVCLFVASSISKVSIIKIAKANMPYLITILLVLLLVAFVPQISLWLPSVFY